MERYIMLMDSRNNVEKSIPPKLIYKLNSYKIAMAFFTLLCKMNLEIGRTYIKIFQ